jgi:murein DD-endopeptidase MepM/ murein hydrolase activator NlpD
MVTTRAAPLFGIAFSIVLVSDATHAERNLRCIELTSIRRVSLVVSVAATCLYFAGCATVDNKLGDEVWYQKTRAATSGATDASLAAAAKAYKRTQKYLAEKDVLATFHDAGEHSEEAVLGVLRKSGLTQPASTRPPEAPGAKPSQKPPASVSLAVPEKYAGSLTWPVDAGIFSSEFGDRWGKNHKGVDIAADVGEPVHAIADGEVIYAGDGLRGYGNVVILRHDKRMSSLYAHNSELKVKQGDHVAQGALVSLLGSTGHSTGPHVHFEIREGDVAVNPRSVLPKPTFGQVAQEGGADHGAGERITTVAVR